MRQIGPTILLEIKWMIGSAETPLNSRLSNYNAEEVQVYESFMPLIEHQRLR